MRLIHFEGTGIRGYQDHHFEFKDKITFLTGINGSGKTTILNLTYGLLKPSCRILDSIEFEKIRVIFDAGDNKQFVSVICSKNNDSIKYDVYQGVDNTSYNWNRIFDNENDDENRKNDEMYIRSCEEFERSEACRIVASYTAPMFLTLERTPQNYGQRYLQRRGYQNIRFSKGNIDTCLLAIQEAINNKRTSNTNKQNAYILELRNEIVKTSLSFMANNELFIGKRPNWDDIEISKITKREKDFQEAIRGLDIPDLQNISNDFFSKLKNAANVLLSSNEANKTKKTTDALLTWGISQKQLVQIDEIISHWHKYQKKVNELQEPLNRLAECVNMFFHETGKDFYIDQNGCMQVKCKYAPEGMREVNVMGMSSGEKQIIAMLGSLIFSQMISGPDRVLTDEPKSNLFKSSDGTSSNAGRNTPEVYFIDEPEVSLHLAWQDIFVDALMKACPDYQFVLATHSPNIISKEERRDWCVNLSPKNLKNYVR